MDDSHESEASNRNLTYLQAIREAQLEEMRNDDSVVLMGEDIRSNFYGTTHGLADEFGHQRVLNTPLSEAGFLGAAIGAAMSGLRPVVDLEMASFIYIVMDQLVSQAAKNRYMFGGQFQIPIVVRAAMFYGNSVGAQHSDRPYPALMGIPGLKVVTPSNPTDAKYLLKAAIRDDGPVVVLEDQGLWGMREQVPATDTLRSRQVLGVSRVARQGDDITLVAVARTVRMSLQVAESLEEDNLSIEVIDPCTLLPADWDTIFRSVKRTGRLLVVDPATRTGSFASECVARVAMNSEIRLKAPPVILATPDVHTPFAPAMERNMYPNVASITDACRRLVATKF
jgi:pyruvate/2-oxoglutarate/acetoin dehydrogenase E1 component